MDFTKIKIIDLVHRRNAKLNSPNSCFNLEKQVLVYINNSMAKNQLGFNRYSLAFWLNGLSHKEKMQTVKLSGSSPSLISKNNRTLNPEMDYDNMDYDDFARLIFTLCKESTDNKKMQKKVKDFIGKCVQNKMKKFSKSSFMTKQMYELKTLFRFGQEEVEFLMLTVCYQLSPSLQDTINGIEIHKKRDFLGLLTGIPSSKLCEVTSKRGTLAHAHILEFPYWQNKGDFYQVAPDIKDYLMGMGGRGLLARFVCMSRKPKYEIDCFGLPEDSVRIVKRLVESNEPCNILLYGVPGSGKTEFARALGKASGKPVYDVNHVTTENLFGGRIALETARAAYKAGTAILIVDEADELLNMQSYSSSFLNSTNISGKGYLNDFMDRNESQIIWICNKISGMEVSSARRFSHSIQFKKHSTRRRQEIWKEHLRRHPYKKMITPEDVTEMARKYQIDSSGIANALTQVAKTVSPKEASRKVVMDTLETLLSGHEKLTGSENTSRMSSLSSQYDVDAIRTDIPTKEVIHSLQSFNGNSKCNACANLLFWGATGTGKTAFAQYLAFTLEKELMIKRASDLLSMWVGGTEQNIKDAFAQAEHEKAILLLDEADSFFIDRTTAVRSWESSQTNEFLTQMENYRGILVCCTNLLSNLDQAVLRRFAWKVHFQPPTAEGRKRIYIRYFGGSDKKIPDSCMELISRMDNLMPGDIKAVWTRFQFRSLNYWNHEEVVQALAQEVSYRVKKGPIEGFQTL